MIYEVKENYNKHLYFHSVQLIFFLHTFNIYYICTIYTSEPAWLQYNYEHCTQHRTCTIFLFSGLYHKKIMYMRQQVKFQHSLQPNSPHQTTHHLWSREGRRLLLFGGRVSVASENENALLTFNLTSSFCFI